MSYASTQFLLISYKSQKADAEFKLGQVTNKYNVAVKESDKKLEDLEAAKAQLDSASPDYIERCKEVEYEYRNGEGGLADLAADEEMWQQEMSNLNTEIKQLDGYIESWQAKLQTDVAKTHNYGPAASGG